VRGGTTAPHPLDLTGRYRAAVTDPIQRPLLFLDIDGPLIPFGGAPERYPTFAAARDLPSAGAHPLLTRINPEHGPRLAALPCEVVWATTWMDDANECIAPVLGLPPLPVVAWPEPSDVDDQDVRDGRHWKTRALVAWAAGRRSPGPTTRSPTPIAPGSPPTTQDPPCSIASTPASA
jgi:hypothetical protein